jgi:crotonobetainyl-CoA:carnitine CoA-transferase CaiB-like acyl-CoA transferase
VTTDDQWRALVAAMGSPDWAQKPSLATNAGRLAAHDEIDGHMSDWTVSFEDYELFHKLQAAGVPAAPVLESSRVFDDPHARARGLYQPQTLFGGIGPYRFATPFIRFSESPTSVRQPPVAFGEHNDYVYRELLGVDDAEFDRLVAAGHIAQDFDESIP